MSQYRIRMLALLSSLFLHLLFLLLTWNVDFMRVDESALRARVDDVVELFLVPESAEAPGADRPTAYTSVPERHEAERPPDDPDFLALRDSRAADLVPDGDADAEPAASRESDVTQVAIRRFEPGPAADGVTVVDAPPTEDPSTPPAGREPVETVRGQTADPSPEAEAPSGEPDATDKAGEELEVPAGEADSPAEDAAEPQPELADLPARTTPSILEALPGAVGDPGFENPQSESGRTAGNMVRFGEYQLNTIAWEFAPWLEQFRRDFLPNWIPPYAYMLGVISGMTTLRLVVEMDGTIGGLEIVDSRGHESLHSASVAALRSAAPYAPLPDDFPEENLVIILSLHYPAWSQ